MSRVSHAGAGDRWLAGEPLAGVAFGPGQSVALARGTRAGARATVLLLVALEPEPLYRVRVQDASGASDELHVRQSALSAANV